MDADKEMITEGHLNKMSKKELLSYMRTQGFKKKGSQPKRDEDKSSSNDGDSESDGSGTSTSGKTSSDSSEEYTANSQEAAGVGD